MVENFLPNIENFFKYLLTIGVLMIAFTLIYPVQKQKEVDIEILTYEKDTAILGVRIEMLKTEMNELKSELPNVQRQLDSLKVVRNRTKDPASVKAIESSRIDIKQEFDTKKRQLLNTADSLKIYDINNESQKKKIERLKSYFDLFVRFKKAMLVLGMLFVLVGLRYWFATVYREELIKDKGVLNENPPYKSSIIRHVDYCKQKFFRKWTVWAFIVVVFITVVLLIYMC